MAAPSATRQPFHDRAVIISSGDEIITGQLLDTNSRYLAERLMEAGILPVEHITVPDDLPVLAETIRRAAAKAPLVIMSGGLGPTDGDLTRTALAEVLGEPLVTDPAAHAAISAMLAKRGRDMSDRQARQAQRPAGAACLPNPFGTAPGLLATIPGPDRSADLFCLPGPPGELKPMFAAEVQPRLRPVPGTTVATRLLHIVGVPEAECVARLGDLTRRDANPLVGITASGGILTLRIRYAGPAGRAAAEKLLDAAEARARTELGDHLFAAGSGIGYELLARSVVERLKGVRQTLAVVESCTGGMLGQYITTVPGSSAAFLGGFQTYANSLKESLGVDPARLHEHGAVSSMVAAEMAACGRARSAADWCLSITGVAGPDGGSEAKPVGTVFIGLAHPGKSVETRKFLFTGGREDVRSRSCTSALAMLHFALAGHPPGSPKLLWEVP